jgi:predicted metal-binding membrane protein
VFNFLNLHHRNIVLVTLIIISLSCWFYTVNGIGMNMSAWEMTLINLNINKFSNSMEMMSVDYSFFNFIDIIFVFLMWFLMMVAMMLPTAIPFIMMFDKISNERKKHQYTYSLTINFFLSYIFVWALFSFCVTIIHFLLQKLNILNPSTLNVGYLLGGFIFVCAGVYQMSPYKEACLKYCRNPIEFLSGKKIFHNLGAFYIGFKHGVFCVGCCWVLMLLLFYSGIMNIFWILGLSLYVMIEKFLFIGKIFNILTGLVLIFFGFGIILINL